MDSSRELGKRLFMQREENISHAPYENELVFYEAVKRGDIKFVRASMGSETLGSPAKGMGVLSRNPIRNLTYHCVISVAMITRFCMEGGMNQETAYSLSDMYIQQMDVAQQVDEIRRLYRQMCLDFTQRMNALSKAQIYSKHIVICIDYINDHINDRITAEDLAEHCELNVNYLSRLFKQETKETLSDYIRRLKVDAAKNMLKYSNYSLLEIANNLAFSSQSHFVKVFKDYTGKTPKEYRDHYYRTNWGENEHV